MTAAVSTVPLSLDQLSLGTRATIASIDWASLDQGEARRLRHFGFDAGMAVEPLHRGPLGRDPLAVRIGRMTVAIRRSHARAVMVEALRGDPVPVGAALVDPVLVGAALVEPAPR